MSNIGVNVDILRKKNNMSITDVSNKSGVSRMTIYRVIKRNCDVQENTVCALAETFGTTVQKLLFGSFSEAEENSQQQRSEPVKQKQSEEETIVTHSGEELKDIGKKIAYLRMKKKLSARELAKKANVSEKTVTNVENGRHEQRMSTLQKLAQALGKTLDELCRVKFEDKMKVSIHDGKKIDMMRRKQRMSIKELAQRAELSETTVKSAINGTHKMRGTTAQKIAKGLGTIPEIFND